MRNTSIRCLALTVWLAALPAIAQEPPAPDDPAATPEEAPASDPPAPVEPAPAPAPAEPAPAQPAPQPYAQPAPQPYAQPAPQPYAQPAPAPAAPPPSTRYEGEAGYQYGNEYGADANADDEGGDGGDGFEMPPFSIRLDPFSWLIEGRLGIELEVGLWKFISLELVPVLVANSEPPTFNFSGRDDPISQESNGLGPFSGTSLGVGFWLNGEPHRGYVLRAIFTNYGYTYEASDSTGVFDRVSHTERQLVGFFGSYARWGVFTLGGGIGLGYELNQKERCNPTYVPNVDGSDRIVAGGPGGCDELQIALDDRAFDIANLNSFLHPVVLMGRFSLGVSFD
jgi:hypothetical protein